MVTDVNLLLLGRKYAAANGAGLVALYLWKRWGGGVWFPILIQDEADSGDNERATIVQEGSNDKAREVSATQER